MCNELVPEGSWRNPKPIPAEGFGWKLFYRGISGTEDHTPYMNDRIQYYEGEDLEGWIQWKSHLGKDMIPTSGDGFCFFLHKPDPTHLEPLKRYCGRYALVKIEYRGGLQEREEPQFCDGRFRVALCKSFRILGEEEYANEPPA